jgi:hemerythrin-like domain-containing protein
MAEHTEFPVDSSKNGKSNHEFEVTDVGHDNLPVADVLRHLMTKKIEKGGFTLNENGKVVLPGNVQSLISRAFIAQIEMAYAQALKQLDAEARVQLIAKANDYLTRLKQGYDAANSK